METEINYSKINTEKHLDPLRGSLTTTLDYLEGLSGEDEDAGRPILLGGSPGVSIAETTRFRIIDIIQPDGSFSPESHELVSMCSSLLVSAVTVYAGLDPNSRNYEEQVGAKLGELYLPKFIVLPEQPADVLLKEEGARQKLAGESPIDGLIFLSLPAMIKSAESLAGFRRMYDKLFRMIHKTISLVNDPDSTAGWIDETAFVWGEEMVPFPEPSPHYNPDWRESYAKGGVMLCGLAGEIDKSYEPDDLVIDFLGEAVSKYVSLNLSWKAHLPEILQNLNIVGRADPGNRVATILVEKRAQEIAKDLIFVPGFSINVQGIDHQLAKELRRSKFLDWRSLGETLVNPGKGIGFFIMLENKQPLLIIPEFTDKPKEYSMQDIFGMLSFINPMFMQLIAETSYNTGRSPLEVARERLQAKMNGTKDPFPVANWEMTISYLEKASEVLNGFARHEEKQSMLNAMANELREPALRSILQIKNSSMVGKAGPF